MMKHGHDKRSGLPVAAGVSFFAGVLLASLAVAKLKRYHTAMRSSPYILPAPVARSMGIVETNHEELQLFTLNDHEDTDFITVFLHGGGYIKQMPRASFFYCNKLANRLNSEVVVPIYPLAPKHTFDESYELLVPLYEDILARRGARKIVLMGDSAGGGLAAGLCQHVDALGLEQPDALVMISPWLDVSMSNPDIAAFEARDHTLKTKELLHMGRAWAGEGVDMKDYRISPMYGDISALRNVLMFVGTRELFYPDVMEFDAKLAMAGIRVETIVGKGMPHDYALWLLPEAYLALETIHSFLNQI